MNPFLEREDIKLNLNTLDERGILEEIYRMILMGRKLNRELLIRKLALEKEYLVNPIQQMHWNGKKFD